LERRRRREVSLMVETFILTGLLRPGEGILAVAILLKNPFQILENPSMITLIDVQV
jgi:hypothetical protein